MNSHWFVSLDWWQVAERKNNIPLLPSNTASSPSPTKTTDPLTRGLERQLILVIFSCTNFHFPTQSEISAITLVSRTLTSLFSQNNGKLMFSIFFYVSSFDNSVCAIFASRNFNLGIKFKSLASQAKYSYVIYLLTISWLSKEAVNGNYWRDLSTYKRTTCLRSIDQSRLYWVECNPHTSNRDVN